MTALRAEPRRLSTDGISYLRWASVKTNPRPPFVLLHGIGSQAESWEPLVAAMEADAEIIAWDAPGYGGSSPLSSMRPSPDDFVEALATFLDALGIARVIVVGHSLGCIIGAHYTASRPQHVVGLGLLSPALGYKMTPDEALPPSVQARIDDLDRLGPEGFAEARAANLVYDAPCSPDLVAKIRRGMAAVRQPGYGQAARMLAVADLLTEAQGIFAPTLVAVGAEDRITPPEGARRLHALLPRAIGMFEVEVAGHALPQQAPHKTAELLADLANAADKTPALLFEPSSSLRRPLEMHRPALTAARTIDSRNSLT